jgi:transcriptional repressor NrdR
MVCPYCKNLYTRVVDKRDNNETNSTRRRRECEKCGKRFTSYERIEKVLLNVEKRNGRIEEFDREKIKRGIMKALGKRDISQTKLNEVIEKIEQKFLNSEQQIIKSKEIGQMVLKELNKIDKLSALLFASVYKEFKTLEDVEKELERLAKVKS